MMTRSCTIRACEPMRLFGLGIGSKQDRMRHALFRFYEPERTRAIAVPTSSRLTYKRATFVRAGEVHDAPNKARHGCGRPRDGERAVSS
jgi:hypothetical protein